MATLFATVDRFKNDTYIKDNFVIKASTGSRSAAETTDDDLQIQPGSSLNVYIVTGDITISANGTVTMVEDGTVYAFGHPFFGFGEVEMPFHQAAVITTLSDYLGSYKMAGGNAGSAAGTITNDYYSAIKGRIGQAPRTLAVGLDVHGKEGFRTINVEIAHIPLMTKVFIDGVILNSIHDGYKEVGFMPAGTAQEMAVTTEIQFDEGLPSIVMSGFYYFGSLQTLYNWNFPLPGAIQTYVGELSSLIAELEERGILPKIRSIGARVVFGKVPEKEPVSPVGGNVTIKKVTPKLKEVARGSNVPVDLIFNSLRGNKIVESTMTVSVPVPSDVSFGTDIIMSVGRGVQLMSPTDSVGATQEYLVQYYRHLFQPGIFIRLDYQVADKMASRETGVNVELSSLYPTLTVKTTTKKSFLYVVSTSFVINSKDTASATLKVEDETKKKPTPKKKDSWFQIDY
jgi:hypothetical protein